MRWIMVALLFVSSAAVAGEVTLTWTTPTGTQTCSESSDPLELAGIRIYRMVADLPGSTPPEEWSENGLTEGTYRYVATAYDVAGTESNVSTPTEKTVGPLTAPAGATVYQVANISGGFWFIPMGTLSEDVTCNAGTRANDRYGVPIESVTWNPGVDARPVLVVADCT